MQHEREQRLALKKELEQLKSAEHIMNLTNMANSFMFGVDSGYNDDELDALAHGPSALKHLETSFNPSNDQSPRPGPGPGPDLFSEVHGATIGNLENQIEKTEKERKLLQERLKQLQKQFDEAKSFLGERADDCLRLMRILERLDSDPDANSVIQNSGFANGDEIHSDESFQRLERRLAVAIRDLDLMQKKLESAGTGSERGPGSQNGVEIEKLLEDLQTVSQIAGDSQTDLLCAQDELIALSEILAQSYHHVCMAQGKTPDRVMLDVMKKIRLSRTGGEILEASGAESDASGAESASEDPNRQIQIIQIRSRPKISEKFFESLRERLKSEFRDRLTQAPMAPKTGSKREGTMFEVVDALKDQMKYLRRAIESALETSAGAGAAVDSASAEVEELQGQNVKLRSMLSTKREQIATLRTVLKSNKMTAEAALSNLKQKYESEKTIVTETMGKLRHELKALKEDAATFASLRAMFSARCEEYQAQVSC